MANENKEIKPEGIPTVSASQVEAEGNPTQTKIYQATPPAPIVYLNNTGVTARSDSDEIENQNANADVIKKSVNVQPPVEKPAENKYKSYADIMAELRKKGEDSPEEIEKQDKRAKRYRALALLSDGMSAIGNMVGTTLGAKPIKPSSALNEYGAKYKEMLAERRANNKHWDDMEARGRLMEAKDRFELAKQQKQLMNDLIVTDIKFNNDKTLQGDKLTHETGMLTTKQTYEAKEKDKDRKHETETTQYIQGQANSRNNATNATRKEISNKDKEDKFTGKTLSMGSDTYDVDRASVASAVGDIVGFAKSVKVKTQDGKSEESLFKKLGFEDKQNMGQAEAQQILTALNGLNFPKSKDIVKKILNRHSKSNKETANGNVSSGLNWE